TLPPGASGNSPGESAGNQSSPWPWLGVRNASRQSYPTGTPGTANRPSPSVVAAYSPRTGPGISIPVAAPSAAGRREENDWAVTVAPAIGAPSVVTSLPVRGATATRTRSDADSRRSPVSVPPPTRPAPSRANRWVEPPQPFRTGTRTRPP